MAPGHWDWGDNLSMCPVAQQSLTQQVLTSFFKLLYDYGAGGVCTR